jgi:hypothetical protein
MYKKLLLWLCLLLAVNITALAGDNKPAAEDAAKAVQEKDESNAAGAKRLSGISIVGNDEAPKALYIVPWKSSDIGVETSMGMMLNDGASPVDRDVFMRQLDFYEVSNKK